MAEGYKIKESLAMARARELNRTNEKRLTDEMNIMLQDLRKKMEKIKIEKQTTHEFIGRLKKSTGSCKNSVMPTISEVKQLQRIMNPVTNMTFGMADYKSKREEQQSNSLIVQPNSPANEGNPVAVRKVHPWTSSTARIIARKKPPEVAHPRRRQNSLESENSSDDDDITFYDIVNKKAKSKAVFKKRGMRRQSLPAIAEYDAAHKIVTCHRKGKVTEKSNLINRRHSYTT